MRFVKNVRDWIDPKWIEYLLTHDGAPRPSAGGNPDSPEFRAATAAGYDLTKTYWYHYTFENNTFPCNVEPPFKTELNYMFWFIKMLPGNFMPMHRDPHVTEAGKSNCTRYWIPLQDYEPGHIFVNGTTFLHSYKAGDMWAYTDANEIHGACNIGFTPRLTLHFTTYENE